MTRSRELKTVLTADERDLEKGLRDARRLLADYERQADSMGLSQGKAASSAGLLSTAWGGVRSNALLVAGGITAVTGAATLASAATFRLANDYASAGSEIHDLAERTGFSAEALSEWKYAADQSGTSINGLEVGIRKMQGTVVDAGNGLKGAKDTLAAIGIDVAQLRGLRPEEIFDRITTSLAAETDETTRAALATDLFGRSGTQLLPILAGGAGEVAKLRKEAHELGIVFSKEDADAADQFGDDMGRLNGQIQGVKNAIARDLLPVLNPLVVRTQDWVATNGDQFAHSVAGGIDAIATALVPAVEGAGKLFDFLSQINGLSNGALSHPFGFSAAEREQGKHDWLNSLGRDPWQGPLNDQPALTPALAAENARIIARRAAEAAPRTGGYVPGGGGGGGATPKEDPIVTAWKQINEQLQEDSRTAWLEGGDIELQIIRERNDRLIEETKALSARMVSLGMDEAKSLSAAFESQRDAANEAVEAMQEAAEAERALAKERSNNALDIFKQLTSGGMNGALAFEMAQTAGGLGGEGRMGSVADNSP